MSPRVLTAASLALVLSACATTSSTSTSISGTPRLEPAPATVQASPPAAESFDPTGRWELLLDFNGQSLGVTLELVKLPGGGYGGTLSSQMGNGPIEKATLEGRKMSLTFTAPDGSAGAMNLEFDGTKVGGTWSAAGMGSTLTGARP